ncbi:hypothetical protein [Caballeronia sp. SBC2]|uniref:hypothetical protein n=1 Tax=Caballeronia sp. SBC2 TaxID=2705547 RepID=UPI0019D0E9ED|nr:hypothetical protein [Caballeronia sp. SBC2]
MNDSLEEGRGEVQQVNVDSCGHFFLSRGQSSGDKLTGMIRSMLAARRFVSFLSSVTQRISRGAP